MMGHTHAISGATALLATQPVLADLAPGTAPHGPVQIGTAALVCAGAALLPDLDHPRSTLAHAFGPVTALLSRTVARISGGHRHATHSFAFAAAMGALAYGAGHAGRWWTWAPMVLLAGLALCALGVTHTLTAIGIAVVATAPALASSHRGVTWLGPAVTLGVLAHLAGDCLTGNGCPLLWPSKRRTYLRLVDTGGRFEHLALAPTLIAATALLAAHLGHVWPFTT